ncbi:hypothetical protein EVAR_93575_1 [Eumeta japonica]|uniref:Uncharacterized protein n=1 Tax=Eumeta variegata TaxID=151549 RepID=A0A4C1URU0_EUMVA|nr:hypothetical protein EVAR_93575_1 [Eumeta japonica]
MEIEQSASINEKSDDEVVKENEGNPFVSGVRACTFLCDDLIGLEFQIETKIEIEDSNLIPTDSKTTASTTQPAAQRRVANNLLSVQVDKRPGRYLSRECVEQDILVLVNYKNVQFQRMDMVHGRWKRYMLPSYMSYVFDVCHLYPSRTTPALATKVSGEHTC